MVTIVTGFGRSGLHDWLLQRITALILMSYSLFLFTFVFAFIWNDTEVTFAIWKMLFSFSLMKYFTIIALLSLLVHAWIGLWIVTTDYIKILWLRLFVQFFVNISLIVEFLWGYKIIWSN